ncbi:hypothetical protein PPACK8108_LOCUS20490 [Phakopsora pachyrhizi]|uniref:Uncharacterized protein n=1 Tax=Phakopsora pachyrhizi TaxID=170000 RepID=A0AAV0BHK6_PHAPC|nr:hypothetical protein PPACK8108_LOCUS20490 [Phakopsora pachyrhizi]
MDNQKAQVREVEKREARNERKSKSNSGDDNAENFVQENNLDFEEQEENSKIFQYDSANDFNNPSVLNSELSDTYSSSSEGCDSNEDLLHEKDDIYGHGRADSTWFPFQKKNKSKIEKKMAHCKDKLTVSVLGNIMTTVRIQSFLTERNHQKKLKLFSFQTNGELRLKER